MSPAPDEPGPPRSGGQGGEGGPGDPNAQPGFPRWAIWVIGLMFAGIVIVALMNNRTAANEMPYSEFTNQLTTGQVKSVTISNADFRATGKLKDGKEFQTTLTPGNNVLDQQLQDAQKNAGTEVTYESPNQNSLLQLIYLFLPVLLLLGLMVWMSRRAQGQMGSIMQIGRSRAKVYTTEKPKTTFGDVAGHNGPKQEIKEVVSFLKEPKKFKDLGATIPKGVLLVGPPGTGKTLLARAVAGEAGVPFIAVTGSDFMEMFVGVGAARVRDLFQTARKQAPAVIFIDEIDSIGRKRGAGLGGGHDEREQTLNQLLSEMDGFEGSEGIIMMAATNRPDILDPALLRPGRFDRQIIVPLPTQSERLEILKVHVRDKKLDADVELDTIARGTPGFSGADLSNLTNEAALHAVRAGHTAVAKADFDSARDRVIMGIPRDSLVMSDEEKKITAYHEAGHALCGALQPNANELHKVTILPVGMALGVTQFLPDERRIDSQTNIEADLTMALGGRVAEEVVFGMATTGAQNDLQKATQIARQMVRQWGMSEKLGPVAYGDDNTQVFLGEDIMRNHEYSEQTARVIDEEVARIVNEARRNATHLLTQNRAALDLVAQALLEKESIEGAEVHRLIKISRGEAVPPAPTPAPEVPYHPPAPQVQPAPPVPPTQPGPGFLPPPMAPGVIS